MPRLPGSGGFLACQVAGCIEARDHVLCLGNVGYATATPAQPLTYHGRRFGTNAWLG